MTVPNPGQVRHFAVDMVAAEEMQALRAVEVLEMIGTAEARKVLEGLARGAAECDLTREAKAALERLARRSPGK